MKLAFTENQRGVSLIEVLIAMVILAIGLLGLVGLQGRLHVTQVESYQRAQALILLQDMANRISLNRINAADYVTEDPIGAGMPAPGCPTATTTRVERDVSEWCAYLVGASETLGGSAVGAMVGGRGCVERIDPDAVEVPAWHEPNPGRAGDLAFILFTGSGERTLANRITNGRWALSAFGTASA